MKLLRSLCLAFFVTSAAFAGSFNASASVTCPAPLQGTQTRIANTARTQQALLSMALMHVSDHNKQVAKQFAHTPQCRPHARPNFVLVQPKKFDKRMFFAGRGRYSSIANNTYRNGTGR